MKRNPQEIEAKLKKTGDGLGMGIDENILRSCVILNSIGFKTRQSCEGHADRYNTYPWIDLIWNEELNSPEYYQNSLKEFYETIYQDLIDFYTDRKVNHDLIVSFKKFADEDELIIRLRQKTDVRIFADKRTDKINEYLKEIQDFCEFLNKKYELNY